ncbi:MAG: DUF1071 domain-containing protein [Bacteroidales bacterium]|nr:DUF1071 domain-containing protein [Bacteroidales bacterium]
MKDEGTAIDRRGAKGANVDHVCVYIPPVQKRDWLNKWTANYNGETPEAKELEPFVKQNYGGQSYLPWATMVRMLYRQDPNADLEIVMTKDGNTCHSQTYPIVTKNGTVETYAEAYINQVVVACTFMGVRHVEIYPVQGLRYDAPKVVDQNMVNKAIQRAKAKVISLATGLGFRLYETGDLQFDEPETQVNAPVKPTPTPKPEKATAPAENTDKAPSKANKSTSEDVRSPEVYELATYVHNNMDSLSPVLLTINKAFVKKYNFSITATDELADLLEKFSVIPKPEDTLRALKKMAEDARKD